MNTQLQKTAIVTLLCSVSILMAPQMTQASWFSNFVQNIFGSSNSVATQTKVQKDPITCVVDFKTLTENCSQKNQEVVSIVLDQINKTATFSAYLDKETIVPTTIQETIFLEQNPPNIDIYYQIPDPYKTPSFQEEYKDEKAQAIKSLKQAYDTQRFLGLDPQIEITITKEKATASLGPVSLSQPIKKLVPHMDVQKAHYQLYDSLNNINTDFGGWGISKVMYTFPELYE